MQLSFIKNGTDKRSIFDKKMWNYAIRGSISDSNFIYLNKPKCACTTIKRVLRNAESVYSNNKLSSYSKNVHDVENSPFAHSISHIQTMPDDSFIFTFVRNPYIRIFSCYRDKCIITSDKQKILKPLKELGVGHRFISFQEFLEFIAAQPVEKRDPHWQLMSKLQIPHLLECDFIGSVENFGADMMYVLRCVYPNLNDINLNFLGAHNLNSRAYKAKIEDQISLKNIQLIKELYMEDFKYPESVKPKTF